jgi:hypothetical protein
MEELIQSVPGAQQLFDWFGYWPSFHDAEVLSVELNRTGASKVRVHTFQITREVDTRFFSICDKHCVVTFVLDEITGVELAHFNYQNALQGLGLRQENDEFVLRFAPAHGLEGVIRAKYVTIEMLPEIPSDSQYKILGG